MRRFKGHSYDNIQTFLLLNPQHSVLGPNRLIRAHLSALFNPTPKMWSPYQPPTCNPEPQPNTLNPEP